MDGEIREISTVHCEMSFVQYKRHRVDEISSRKKGLINFAAVNENRFDSSKHAWDRKNRKGMAIRGVVLR